MILVRDVYDFLNELAPFSTQETWDNSGIQVGSMEKVVKTLLVSLDVTSDVLAEAENFGAQLLICHHPVIFRARKQILEDDLVYVLAKKGISNIASHTCFDKSQGGVNEVLANVLKLTEEQENFGNYFAGKLKNSMSCIEFSRHVAQKLKTNVRFFKNGERIENVAVCGGAGGSIFMELDKKYDAFVTGEATYHEILSSKEREISLFLAGHYETEWPAMRSLYEKIKKKFPGVRCHLSEAGSIGSEKV